MTNWWFSSFSAKLMTIDDEFSMVKILKYIHFYDWSFSKLDHVLCCEVLLLLAACNAHRSTNQMLHTIAGNCRNKIDFRHISITLKTNFSFSQTKHFLMDHSTSIEKIQRKKLQNLTPVYVIWTRSRNGRWCTERGRSRGAIIACYNKPQYAHTILYHAPAPTPPPMDFSYHFIVHHLFNIATIH